MARKPGARSDLEAAAAAKAVLTTCPFCSCGCGLYLHTYGDILTGVAPSEHHAVSQGRLCSRGWAAHESPTWGERLTQPLARRDGALEPVGWEEALARAAEGLRSARASGDDVGVLGSPRATNEESMLLARMARAALHTGNVDSILRATYQPLLDGLADVGGRGAVQGTLADVEASDVVLLVEGDITHTHTRLGLSVLRALKRGARLVTLGPARTQFARLASVHMPAVPGREQEALCGLVAAALGARGGARSPLPGEQALRQSLGGRAPSERERIVAEWFAGAAHASAVVAPTAAPAPEAREAGRALACFLALTGHLDRRTGAVLVLPARGNLRGACEVGVVPDRLPGAGGPGDGVAVERLSASWGRGLCDRVGLDAEAMLERVSALLVFAEDPPSVLPVPAAARAALERMRCLVVLDAFLTPTARMAHVVLPVAAFGETDGTVTSLEGRLLPVRARVRPPGSARPGWQVLADLLERLDTPPSYASAGEVLAEIAKAVPAFATAVVNSRQGEWGERLDAPPDGEITLGALGVPRAAGEPAPVLSWEGVLDWGSDPLVSFSPTLRRDEVSRRKLYPGGLVGLSTRDAERLGVRPGGTVRLTSTSGEAVLPAVLRADLEPGVVLVPYAFRESVAGVLGGERAREVHLARG